MSRFKVSIVCTSYTITHSTIYSVDSTHLYEKCITIKPIVEIIIIKSFINENSNSRYCGELDFIKFYAKILRRVTNWPLDVIYWR